MLQNLILTLFILLITGFFNLVFGQDMPTKPSVLVGDVTTVASDKVSFNSAKGAFEAAIDGKTVVKKVAADKPDLNAATPATIDEITVGDRVIVTGLVPEGAKSFTARAVYLMSKSDIEKKHAREAMEWRTRGIIGKVSAIDPATNSITVKVAGLMGTTDVVITPKDGARFRRYAKDSVLYENSTASTFGDIHIDDSLRAKGDKSADGKTFAAEEMISGAFQTIAGTVKSVDAENNQVVITDLATKKDVTVSLASAVLMKKYPAEMAERFAAMQQMAAGGGVRPPGQSAGGTPPSRPAGQGQGEGQAGFGGPGRGGSIDEMIERFPNITVADIQVGDMLAVSSTKNADMGHVNAIKLLAGVEPFLRLAQMASARGQGRGQGQGVSGSFTIPGLDDVGFP